MSMENDVTKKIASLEENKDVGGLEEIKNDAEASFDGETVGLAEQAIARLNTKVEEITPPVETTEGQKTQVENMGGSEEKLNEVVTPIDEKIAEKDTEIKNVEIETEQKIGEVKNKKTESTSEFKYDSEEGRTLKYSLSDMSEAELLKIMDKYPHSVSTNNENTRSLWVDIIRENKLSPEELIEIDKKVNDKEGYNDEVIVGRILETGKLPLDKALEIVSRGGGPRPMETFVEKTQFSSMSDAELKKVFKLLDKIGDSYFNDIVKKSGRTKEQIQTLLK